MKTVFKYEVPLEAHVTLKLPVGAQLLHFGNQHNIPTLWALVDPKQPLTAHEFRLAGTGNQHNIPTLWALVDSKQPLTAHEFRLAGTGHEIEEEIVRHIGTAQFAGGSLVFHLFEVLAGVTP